MKKLLPLTVLMVATGCVTEVYTHGPRSLTKNEIIEMHRSGAPDEDIVRIVDRSGMDRAPTPDDIIDMKNAGLSDAVITSAVEAPVRRIEEERVYVSRTTPDPGVIIGATLMAMDAAWHMYEFYKWWKKHR